MATRVYTSDDLLQMCAGDGRYELEQGELVRLAPTGFEHGELVWALGYELGRWIRERRLPYRMAVDVFVRIATGPLETVKGPDLVLVPTDVLAGTTPKGVLEPVPALVVEVISPGDDRDYLEHKVKLYLRRGIAEVWVVDPPVRRIEIHSLDQDRHVTSILTINDTLTSASILPGWSLPLSQAFPP